MPRLAIVHWFPIEMYPPALNLARYFGDNDNWQVTVFTTEPPSHRLAFSHPGVKVARTKFPVGATWRRLGAYLAYHVVTSVRLFLARPDVALYFEPQSSFPVLLSAMLRPGLPIFIHHHEYHAPDEFRKPGMRLPGFFHRIEQKILLPRATWISHTNRERLDLFLADNSSLDRSAGKVSPNYPPASWSERSDRSGWEIAPPPPLRMVYVGSLSIVDTYISELLDWIAAQKTGAVTLDVYGYNVDADARRLLEAQGPAVRFWPRGVEYDEIPTTLQGYHIGVILYKANSPNYRFNASNKLFEYLACGLDVLYPRSMLGVRPYARSEVTPRVTEVDFSSIGSLDIRDLLAARPNRRELPFESSEKIASELEGAMVAALRSNDA